MPPTAPGKAYLPAVVAIFTVDGDVASFDVEAFVTALKAEQAGPTLTVNYLVASTDFRVVIRSPGGNATSDIVSVTVEPAARRCKP